MKGLDGLTIHVHPAYQFENDMWFNLPKLTRRHLVQMRQEYCEKKRRRFNSEDSQQYQSNQDQRSISQTYLHYGNNCSSVPGTVYQLPSPPGLKIPPPPLPRQVEVSQLQREYTCNDTSTFSAAMRQHQGSTMGGRNEQASLHSRNQNGRGISNVITRRRIS